MCRRWRNVLAVLAAWLATSATALAGMGSITLEDIPRVLTLSNLAKLRLDAISFFLACILGSAWAIKLVWNSFAKDFPRLPRISYLRSLGLMGVRLCPSHRTMVIRRRWFSSSSCAARSVQGSRTLS